MLLKRQCELATSSCTHVTTYTGKFSGCLIPESIQSLAGWRLEQLGLMEGGPAHGRGMKYNKL